MKAEYVAVLLASLLALALAHPGVTRDSSAAESSETDELKGDGVVLMLPARHSVFDEAEVDEPLPGYWHSFRFSNPFDGLFTRMQETMNRIRAQMEATLAGQMGQGGLTPWGKVPEGANTTSTTKVIGDHAVTINETTYTDGDENSGTVFRIRIIDVKPLNETAAEAAAGAAESSGEAEAEDAEEVESHGPSATGSPAAASEAEAEDGDREELSSPVPVSRRPETAEELDNEIPKNQVEVLAA